MSHPIPSALNELLDELVNNPAADPSLVALSDLPRPDASALRERWPELPEAARITVLERAVAAALVDLGLDFTELALIGLDDPVPDVRLRAISGLAEAMRSTLPARFLQIALQDPDERVRASSTLALGRFVLHHELGQLERDLGDRITAALVTIAEDVDEPVEIRGAAITSSGFRTSPRIEALMEDAYADDEATIHVSAIRAMGNSANEKWLDYLFEQMQVADSEYRIEAAAATGAIGSEDGIEALKDLLADDDLDVVLAGIEALAEIGGEEGLRALEESVALIPEDLATEYEEAMQAIKDAMDDEEGES